MSRKITKSILSKDEINLLINSEETKKTDLYGNLHLVLSKLSNVKAVTTEQLNDLQANSTAIAALTYNKRTLIDNVISEWYVQDESAEDEDKKVRCGLCNTPNKYLFYIRNRLNGIQLNVGSTCIQKFPGIDGYEEYKNAMNRKIKNQKEIARRTKFHTKFPTVQSILDNASYYFDSVPILLPWNLYHDLENSVKKLRLIYNDYVYKGIVTLNSRCTAFEGFENEVTNFNALKTKSDKFIKENIREPLMCQREEIDWILENKNKKLLQQIANNNGKYTVETIKHITLSSFLIRNFSAFSNCNTYNSIKFNKPKNDYDQMTFTIQHDGYSFIYIINVKQFMEKIGCLCICQNDYQIRIDDLFGVSHISINNNNFNNMVNSIDETLVKFGFVLLIDHDTNDVYIYRKQDHAIKVFSYRKLVEMFSKNIIQKRSDIYQFLASLTCKNWVSDEEQDRKGMLEKISSMYYQQYLRLQTF